MKVVLFKHFQLFQPQLKNVFMFEDDDCVEVELGCVLHQNSVLLLAVDLLNVEFVQPHNFEDIFLLFFGGRKNNRTSDQHHPDFILDFVFLKLNLAFLVDLSEEVELTSGFAPHLLMKRGKIIVKKDSIVFCPLPELLKIHSK